MLGHERPGRGSALAGGRARTCSRSTRVLLPVQVNGKKRAELTIAAGASDAEVERAALALWSRSSASSMAAAREKVIVVPKRIVNVVA